MSALLTAADLRFINRVACRRFGGTEPVAATDDALAAALGAAAAGSTAFARAAQLVAALLQERVFSTAALQTGLLALHCALSLDGLQLLAPQGVLAGMIKGLAAGGDPHELARWLEDRAVPSSGSG